MACLTTAGLIRGDDGLERCYWVGSAPLYVHYHDYEWGKVVKEDGPLFEKICLEGFQSGLSWYTILKKRSDFRRAFDGFNFHLIAQYDHNKVEQLLKDATIIRHQGKIRSVINNARRAIETVNEFGSLANYFWTFQPESARVRCALEAGRDRPPTTSIEAGQLSRDLKQRGWSFVGPTNIYAFMQAVGIVNDHIHGCAFANGAPS